MKKSLIYGIAATMITGMFFFSSGCKSYHRRVSLFPGDRNVTNVKKAKRGKMKNRKKIIRATPRKGING